MTGASFYHHAQGGGIWPDAAGRPNPSPKPLPQRLAAQRRRYTEQCITARVAGLGFADVGDYLTDRVVQRALLLAEVAGEPAAHRLTCAGCWTATGSCFEREQVTVRG